MKQGKFYNAQTRNLSRAHVVSEIVKFTTDVVGNSYYSAVKSGFNDTKTDLKTRVSFKVRLSVSCLNMWASPSKQQTCRLFFLLWSVLTYFFNNHLWGNIFCAVWCLQRCIWDTFFLRKWIFVGWCWLRYRLQTMEKHHRSINSCTRPLEQGQPTFLPMNYLISPCQ